MTNSKLHIGFKFASILLVASLLCPSFIKFNHIFEDHEHEVCKGKSIQHFHEIDLDCEFYKFNTVNQFFGNTNDELSLLEFIILSQNDSPYYFINSHQQLSFSLRGPPIASSSTRPILS